MRSEGKNVKHFITNILLKSILTVCVCVCVSGGAGEVQTQSATPQQ